MSTPLELDPKTTALVLIDLEHGIVSRDLAPHPASQVIHNGVRLANAVRSAGGTVVFVHVNLADVPNPPADNPRPQPGTPPPASASQLVPELGVQPTDLVILKHQWGAFYNTPLEDELRSRGIQTIVLGGIATNFGVESTARAAFDRRFSLVFVEDATSSMRADLHQFSMEKLFPVMGRVRSTEEVLAAFA